MKSLSKNRVFLVLGVLGIVAASLAVVDLSDDGASARQPSGGAECSASEKTTTDGTIGLIVCEGGKPVPDDIKAILPGTDWDAVEGTGSRPPGQMGGR